MNSFGIDTELLKLAKAAERLCLPVFAEMDAITEYHQQKVLKAFIDSKVSESHFCASTGYGYGDPGREKLEEVFSDIFGAEDSLVRYNFVSGTHALTVALFGILRPGDEMLCVTGEPYDTLKAVIGHEKASSGSLKEFGIAYKQLGLAQNGKLDYNGIKNIINPLTRLVYVQRSRGYALRQSLFVEEIKNIVRTVKESAPECILLLDNCYCEFVEKEEPANVGVDLIVGSLIKNPGGGLAKTGGYIAGKRDLIKKCANRLTSPGLGREVGASLGSNREIFMGLFNAPHVTGEALKTAVFAAALFEIMGYDVSPRYCQPRSDIVQAIKMGEEKSLIAFCQGLQKAVPIDSFLRPEPWDMPGYANKVIMAAGTFTLGASIELSADAPLREPYAVWLQGGLNFHSAKLGILRAAQEIK